MTKAVKEFKKMDELHQKRENLGAGGAERVG